MSGSRTIHTLKEQGISQKSSVLAKNFRKLRDSEKYNSSKSSTLNPHIQMTLCMLSSLYLCVQEYIYVQAYTFLQLTTSTINEAIILKENWEGFIGEFRKGKERGKLVQLFIASKIKENNLKNLLMAYCYIQKLVNLSTLIRGMSYNH